MDLLSAKYKEWLAEAEDAPIPSMEGEVESALSPEVAQRLIKIANFAANSEEMMSDVLGYYGEVRSTHLMNSLSKLFRDSDAPIKGSYQKGSHSLIAAIRKFFRLAHNETIFARQVLPEQYLEEALRRAIKHPADLVKMSCEAAGSRVSKATAKGEFVDQIWIFDVTDVFNDLFVKCDLVLVRTLIKPALKSVTSGAVDFLRELVENINESSKSTASANATVFEQTSTLLNCLKRMLEYERIIEALLHKWAQKESWDGIVGPVGNAETETFSMALYYKDLLNALEVAIEKHSKDYRKAIVGILFQLNNFNYIMKTFKNSNLSAIITMESEQKYELIVDSLLKEYLNYWRSSAMLLVDGTPRATTLSPKDRLKTFAAEFEDLVKGQEVCAVPDTELRIKMIAKVREVVVPPFVTFYNMYFELLFKHFICINLVGINHCSHQCSQRSNWILRQ